MLHAFLSKHRLTLIDDCRRLADARMDQATPASELEWGVPAFLDQLIKTLSLESSSDLAQSLAVSGLPSRGSMSEIAATATRHGRELLLHGFTLDQVVRDYGDVCQAVTTLALARGQPIEVGEFRTLNRCLDNAVAGAVTEYASRRSSIVAEADAQALNATLGCLAHELRNYVGSATLALQAIRTGSVGLTGATGRVLDRSLIGIQTLIDRSLADVRANAALPHRQEMIRVAPFIADAAVFAAFDPHARACRFNASEADPDLAVYADRHMLHSAISNLLQNAFKFTAPETTVSLRAFARDDRVLLEIEDHCGGLPSGAAETLFAPFQQRGEDRSGLGLGLDISRRAVEANGGRLRVRDKPGSGCVFVVDLPRRSLEPAG